eukprot:Hpha_TRINITY_DN31565_c0_g1::TRINITY_DN31565_c0_g1_i1::g.1718::m.1718
MCCASDSLFDLIKGTTRRRCSVRHPPAPCLAMSSMTSARKRCDPVPWKRSIRARLERSWVAAPANSRLLSSSTCPNSASGGLNFMAFAVMRPVSAIESSEGENEDRLRDISSCTRTASQWFSCKTPALAVLHDRAAQWWGVRASRPSRSMRCSAVSTHPNRGQASFHPSLMFGVKTELMTIVFSAEARIITLAHRRLLQSSTLTVSDPRSGPRESASCSTTCLLAPSPSQSPRAKARERLESSRVRNPASPRTCHLCSNDLKTGSPACGDVAAAQITAHTSLGCQPCPSVAAFCASLHVLSNDARATSASTDSPRLTSFAKECREVNFGR